MPYRPNAGRPPSRDPAAYAAYIKLRNHALTRQLAATRAKLAEARSQLATCRVPLVPADERQRRLAAWFERQDARLRRKADAVLDKAIGEANGRRARRRADHEQLDCRKSR